jgi:hypothetical protein
MAVIPLQTLSSWPLPAQGLWPIIAGETEGQMEENRRGEQDSKEKTES